MVRSIVRHVIALEGAQGVGKTTLLSHLKSSFDTEDEVFVDVAASDLNPQGFLSEATWVAGWFQRVIKNESPTVLFIDRSPHSAVLYAKAHNDLIASMVAVGIRELAEIGICIHTVNVRVPEEELWRRVTERLERCPERVKYNEGDREWLRTCIGFYEQKTWEKTIDNTDFDTALAALHDFARTLC